VLVSTISRVAIPAKLSGYTRVETAFNTNSVYTGNTSGVAAAHNRLGNVFTSRARLGLNLDTRTATEYGVLRTFFAGTFTWTDGSFGAAGGASTYAGDGVAGGSLGVYYAFIQFAGFTMGKSVSQFSAPWVSYPGNNFDGLVGGGGTVTGVNQLTYTAQLGNGVSITGSLQDPNQYYQAGVNNLGLPGAFGYGTNNQAGNAAPDIVGKLEVDQAWGMFEVTGAAHNNHAGYYGGTEPTGHPSDKWGFAVGAALQIKNIPTGAGDDIKVQGVYTNGATRYNIQDLAGQAGASVIFGGSSVAGVYNTLGIGFAPDSVFAVNGGHELVSTWGMRGAFNHNWDPHWSSSLYGAYAAVSYNNNAKALLCGAGGTIVTLAGAGMTTCNPDYSISQLGGVTRWTPVKGFTISGDLLWTHLDQRHAGTAPAAFASIGKPAGTYQFSDENTYQISIRAQRNF